MFVQFSYANSASVAVVAKVDKFFTIAPAALNLLSTSTSVDAYLKTFLPLESLSRERKRRPA